MGLGRRYSLKQDECGGCQAKRKCLRKKKSLSNHEKQEGELKGSMEYDLELHSPLHLRMPKYESQCKASVCSICLPQDSVNYLKQKLSLLSIYTLEHSPKFLPKSKKSINVC